MQWHLPKTSARRALVATAAILSAFLATASHAQTTSKEIHVVAASDLQPVMPALSDAYEHATGIKLIVSFGSSSTLATQILHGEPADLFLAADYSFPEKIVIAGLADSSSPISYARGTLVLFARKDSPFQPLDQNTLRRPDIKSLAVAEQFHAPYGLAAVRALTAMKLHEGLKSKIVMAENVGQAAQFVESGNAQLGLISLTLASSGHMKEVGTFLRMPKVYPDIVQYAVVMKKSSHRAEAHAFLDWLRSAPIQHTLPQFGLDPAP